MHKILILGGGFGGIRCALDLSKKIGNDAQITLVDKNSYHLFVPSLYEVASAYGVKQDPFAVHLKKTICISYSDIFSAKGGPASGGEKVNPVRGRARDEVASPEDRGAATSNGINFIQAEISSIDLENKKVITRGGEILDYDYLVIALGGQVADFDIPGVKEYAFQFKELEDALLLNQKVEELTKEVAENKRERPIKIAVVGAGFTGIEVAAEFACCVKKLSRVCGIKGRCERIILLEAGPKILPSVSDRERKDILKRLTQLGVEIIENATAEEIGGDYIKLKNGKRLGADLVIWTAGIRLPDLLSQTLDLPLTKNKKIKVNNGLELVGLPGVFAIGDNIEFIDPKTSKPVPALAYVATDQGKIVAKNIKRLINPIIDFSNATRSQKEFRKIHHRINNEKIIEYKPFYGVWIAPVGGKYALAHLWKGINIKGFWGWVIREIVDLKYLLSILTFKKAVSVFWQEITLFIKND